MAFLKHLLILVLLSVAFLLASCVPDNRRPSRSPPPPRRSPPPPPRRSPPPPPRRSPPPPRRSPPPPPRRSPPPPPPPRSPPPPPPLSPPPPPPTQFDFFHLALNWPNAICNSQVSKCDPSPPKQHFTIHGLWPEKNDGSVLEYCQSSDQMTDAILQKNEKELLEYWPDLENANNFRESRRFWRRQWRKHGTCSSTKFSPEDYLKATLDLGSVYGPLIVEKMKEQGIVPDGATPRTADETLAAIRSATNTVARIRCDYDANGNFQLYDIRICVKADGKTLEDCKIRRPQGSCTSNFIFASPQAPAPAPAQASALPRPSSFQSFVSSILEFAEEVPGL